MFRNVFIFLTGIVSLALGAATVTNTSVSLLRPYKATEQAGFCYTGRVDYKLDEGEFDSVLVDLALYPEGASEAIEIAEKHGDIGVISNLNDSVKTIFFRCWVQDTSSSYVAVVTADANMSRLWHMADSLTGLLTMAQKERQLYGSTEFTGFGQTNDTLGDGTVILGFRSSDGPHGVRWKIGPKDELAYYGAGDTVTLFPTEAAIGCTFDTSVARKIGVAIGEESRSKGIYTNLGPMVDVVVSPKWGRAFETYGEDPYLVGSLGAADVKGLQSRRVIAVPKHFVCYNRDGVGARYTLLADVSERALRELYLPPFKQCIVEGGTKGLMTNYNQIRVEGYTETDEANITKGALFGATNRHTLLDILRGEWGFDGVVVTDWDGFNFVTSTTYSFHSGGDMDMPVGNLWKSSVKYAYDNGWWDESVINEKVRRIFYGKLWAWNGEIFSSESQIKTYSNVLSEEHLNVAEEAAQKSIVLAKNDGVLPLDANSTMNLVVAGDWANTGRRGGGGSSAITPDKIITILEGINEAKGSNVTVNYYSTDDFNSSAVSSSDIAVVVVGVEAEGEDKDRANIRIPDKDDQIVDIAALNASKTIVVYTGGSASRAGNWSNHSDAVVIALYPGRFQGKAVADILFGNTNPSGHLSVTFPNVQSDLPDSFQVDLYEKWLTLSYTSADSAYGYFYCEKAGKKPLYWFGHGLSYTKFNYTDIAVIGGASLSAGGYVDVLVNVENAGDMAGDDVVQLYVKPIGSAVPRRVKDLRGFSRVSLESGEKKTVKFKLVPRDFSYYSEEDNDWVVGTGDYDIIAASTSNPEELIDDSGKAQIQRITIN